MTAPLLALQDYSVAYRPGAESALAGASLSLAPGEKLAIIGESGSGKSTLALALAGLLPPGAVATGEIAWPALGRPASPGRDFGQPARAGRDFGQPARAGRDFGQPARAGRDFGMVFQDPGASLNPVLRIGEQVAEGARRHLGLGWPAAKARALDLLRQVRIPEPEAAMSAFPHQFSGGQRQRIAIAAAIAARPRLLIADEATSALDTIVQAEIVALIDQLVVAEGMALLFITHDIALAARLADRIAVFHRARLVEIAPAAELIAAPASDYARHLLATHIDLGDPPRIAARAR